MVFHGQPSKACERCRGRRLRCDQARPSCTPCLRAHTPCPGYRPTDSLRIKDQTKSVRSKALAQPTTAPTPLKKQQQEATSLAPRFRHLLQDLQVLGRDVFFAHYVADFSRRWAFLNKYVHANNTPEHLGLAIDAVGLAFLAHQIGSPAAREMGRRKYGAALRKTNTFLQDPAAAANNKSAFETALVLDLYEKFAKLSADDASPSAHVKGALALVRLRGIEKFSQGHEIRVLMGLVLYAAIHKLSRGLPIPEELATVTMHVGKFVSPRDPRWRLVRVILKVTDLSAEMMRGSLRPEERVTRSVELERELEKVSMEAAPVWTYERKFAPEHGGKLMLPEGFPSVYDVYPDRTITQMWNVLRMMRMLLCEEIIESCTASQDPDRAAQSSKSELTIHDVVHEICASVPQMTNCDFAARHKLPGGATGHQHTHTVSHMLDVYVLIFCLYVVAWSRHCPNAAREFAVQQLRHIAGHFGVKEAMTTLEILRQQEGEERADPWMCKDGYRDARFSFQGAGKRTVGSRVIDEASPASPLDLASASPSAKPNVFVRITSVYFPSLDRSMYWAYEPRV